MGRYRAIVAKWDGVLHALGAVHKDEWAVEALFEEVRSLTPAEKQQLHLKFHEECPKRCHAGRKLGGMALTLAAPTVVTAHGYQNPETMSVLMEAGVSLDYDSSNLQRRAVCRNLADLLAALKCLSAVTAVYEEYGACPARCTKEGLTCLVWELLDEAASKVAA
jgi:hypothetical protein